MKRIYDWDAKFSLRNYTAADLRALKGQCKFTQTTANTAEEAAAARDAGIDLIMGNAQNTAAVRQGAPDMFFTAANRKGCFDSCFCRHEGWCRLCLYRPRSAYR